MHVETLEEPHFIAFVCLSSSSSSSRCDSAASFWPLEIRKFSLLRLCAFVVYKKLLLSLRVRAFYFSGNSISPPILRFPVGSM